MKRNINFLREILISAETTDLPWYEPPYRRLSDQNRDILKYHIDILLDARLLKSIKVGGVQHAFVLTNKGHDFLSMIKSDFVWKKINEKIKVHGEIDFASINKLATKYRGEEIGLN